MKKTKKEVKMKMSDNTKFWAYMLLAFLIGLIVGYLLGTYVLNNAAGAATGVIAIR